MQIKTEWIVFAITFLSFGSMVTMSVWRSASAVSNIKHELEKKDIILEHLQDTLKLMFNAFKEKFEHFSSRSRTEIEEVKKRLLQVERYLEKNGDFTPRD